MTQAIRAILDRYRVIQVVLFLIPDPLSFCEALSFLFIGPHCPMRPQCSTRAPAAEPHPQLYHFGLPGHHLSNSSCPLALTLLLSAPGAQTPIQAPSYLPLTMPTLQYACTGSLSARKDEWWEMKRKLWQGDWCIGWRHK